MPNRSSTARLHVPLLAVLTAVLTFDPGFADSLAAPLPPLPAEAYAARRQKLQERLARRLGPSETGLFLALGRVEEGESGAPRQAPHFYYLAGVDALSAAMILPVGRPGEEAEPEVLFLREPSARERVYDGPRLLPGRIDPATGKDDAERAAAVAATGFAQVEAGSRLSARLLRALSSAAVLFVATAPVEAGAPLTPELELVASLRDRHPVLRILDAGDELRALRLVKEPAELARIEAAVLATLEGFRRAAPRIRRGSRESDVQAEMEAAFRLSGAQALAFPTIVASGPRSTILHYMANDSLLEEGALVVIDAGAMLDGYAADVTRTFPVSGTFNTEQRRLYDKVLEAQEAGIRAARPGVTIEEIDRRVNVVLEKAQLADGVKHTCCHTVGLEVHDAGGSDTMLAPGMVLTIEPGIYFPDRALGIRVEDTFVVTENGVRSLSGALPRGAEEVERFLAASR